MSLDYSSYGPSTPIYYSPDYRDPPKRYPRYGKPAYQLPCLFGGAHSTDPEATLRLSVQRSQVAVGPNYLEGHGGQ